MTSLDPSAILYGQLEARWVEPEWEPLRDTDGQILYEHQEIKSLLLGRRLYPMVFYTDRRGIKTWEQALEQEAVHRLGGPAALWADGCEAWYRWGHLHREDGPARLTHHDHHGRLRKLYYLDGKRLSEADWKVLTRIRSGARRIP